MKLGVVVIPATTLLTPDELRDRLDRGRAKAVVATQDQVGEIRRPRRRHIWCASWSARPRADGWLPFEQAAERLRDVYARRRDQGRRPDAALFHLGHHGKAKAGAAQPAQLSRRPSVDDVLARAAARRRASQHLLAGLGQARLELLLRALERRRHGLRRQPAALRRQGPAGDHRALRRHHALRAADGVAAVHPGGAVDLQGLAARGLRRRRAAQSRSHRAGAGGLGPDHPRRLRPDRDHRAGRQFAGPEGQGRLDGPAAAGLSRARSSMPTASPTKRAR